MTQPAKGATDRTSKLLGSVARRIKVALASGLLLGAGAMLAPPASPTAVPASQEHAAPLLEAQMQSRVEVQPLRRVEDVAARVRHHGVALLPPSTTPAIRSDFSSSDVPPLPPKPGVFVGDGFVLTHAAALDGRSTLSVQTADGDTRQAAVAAYEPSSELVLLKISGTPVSPATIVSTAPVPGTLVAGIGSTRESVIVVPVFISSVEGERYRLSATYGALRAGTPLYTIDGGLIAVAGPDGDAFAAATAISELSARASSGDRLASIGIAFQELTPELIRVFGDNGALISAVVDEAPAERAGLQPGDVLTAVGDVKVDAIDVAIRALRTLSPGIEATLSARRGERQHSFKVMPALAYDVAALGRRRTGEGLPRPAGDSRSTAPETRIVLPVITLIEAGIPPDAQILAINRRGIASRAQAVREITRSRTPVLLLLRHGSRQFFAVIPPQR